MDPAAGSLGAFLNAQGEGETWNPETELFKDKGPMFIFQGDGYQAYNYLDAGNFIWGNFMSTLGYSLGETKSAAIKFNPNDTKADGRSIQNGFLLKNYKKIFKNVPVKNPVE